MKTKLIIKSIVSLLLLCVVIVSCNTSELNSDTIYQPVFANDTLKKNTLIFGFPSFSYAETAEPLISYLNRRLSGTRIILKACSSYDDYMNGLNKNEFDLTLLNGIQSSEAESHGYSIRGKLIGDDNYRGVIFVRKDANIKEIKDLKKKRVAFSPSRMVPGTIMPIYYLYQNGIDISQDIDQVYVSSFESAIITTYLDKSDAGFCQKRNWNVYIKNHPDILSKVDLKWETPPLINNALLVKNSNDSAIISQLTLLLFSMHNTKEGKEALNRLDFIGFEKANTATYKPMTDFKKKYDSVIL